MNEQSQMMNQSKIMKQQIPQMMSQPPPSQMMSQPPPSQMMSQPPPPQMMSHPPQQMMNQPIPLMSRNYGLWQQQPPVNPAMDQMMFQNPFNVGKLPGPGRSNWKGKKGMNKQQDLIARRNEQVPHKVNNLGNQHLTNMGGAGYQPPTLMELQSQNRTKARKYYHPKKQFNNRFVPYAPRNTSSFIIRAKKSGGIASLVSPCPVTPAVLPTPVFSPSREVLGDIAKEEWGVDGYGSMKGLIRLRSPGNDPDDDDDDDVDGSSDSDVEEHVEVERRLDHDLSRFEMIYPNGAGSDYNNLLENRVDDQDTHIAHLEEENLTLKERLFLMEREMGDLRRRLQSLERLARVPGEAIEEVVENGSDNDAESSGKGEDRQLGVGYNEELEYVDERREGDDDSFPVENTEAVAEVMVKNHDGRYGIVSTDLDNVKMGKESEGDVDMEESGSMQEQNRAEGEMQDANHEKVCDKNIMGQANVEETIQEKLMGGSNVEEVKVVGAEKV